MRGRDAHCWPPAQIPACPIQAPGSYLIGGKAILFHKDELGDASGLSQQVREVVGNRAPPRASAPSTSAAVHVLVAIIKKRLNLDASLYTSLQILSVTLFERMPIQQAFPADADRTSQGAMCNQLNWFTI